MHSFRNIIFKKVLEIVFKPKKYLLTLQQFNSSAVSMIVPHFFPGIPLKQQKIYLYALISYIYNITYIYIFLYNQIKRILPIGRLFPNKIYFQFQP